MDVLLVGIDGSEGGRRAADFAAAQAQVGNARLVVAYVIEWSPYTFNTPEENEMRHKRREEEIERAKAEVLDPLVTKLKITGAQVEGLVRHGHAAQVLCDLTQETGASQIFIGRRGLSKLTALLFGSVAIDIVKRASVPVLAVHRKGSGR